jgi:hypothetical protein
MLRQGRLLVIGLPMSDQLRTQKLHGHGKPERESTLVTAARLGAGHLPDNPPRGSYVKPLSALRGDQNGASAR